jgi:hypothetical protein
MEAAQAGRLTVQGPPDAFTRCLEIFAGDPVEA